MPKTALQAKCLICVREDYSLGKFSRRGWPMSTDACCLTTCDLRSMSPVARRCQSRPFDRCAATCCAARDPGLTIHSVREAGRLLVPNTTDSALEADLAAVRLAKYLPSPPGGSRHRLARLDGRWSALKRPHGGWRCCHCCCQCRRGLAEIWASVRCWTALSAWAVERTGLTMALTC